MAASGTDQKAVDFQGADWFKLVEKAHANMLLRFFLSIFPLTADGVKSATEEDVADWYIGAFAEAETINQAAKVGLSKDNKSVYDIFSFVYENAFQCLQLNGEENSRQLLIDLSAVYKSDVHTSHIFAEAKALAEHKKYFEKQSLLIANKRSSVQALSMFRDILQSLMGMLQSESATTVRQPKSMVEIKNLFAKDPRLNLLHYKALHKKLPQKKEDLIKLFTWESRFWEKRDGRFIEPVNSDDRQVCRRKAFIETTTKVEGMQRTVRGLLNELTSNLKDGGVGGYDSGEEEYREKIQKKPLAIMRLPKPKKKSEDDFIMIGLERELVEKKKLYKELRIENEKRPGCNYFIMELVRLDIESLKKQINALELSLADSVATSPQSANSRITSPASSTVSISSPEPLTLSGSDLSSPDEKSSGGSALGAHSVFKPTYPLMELVDADAIMKDEPDQRHSPA